MKKITYFLLASFFAIAGCSSNRSTSQYYDVPVDYLENKATVLDSFQTYSLSGTEFFVVSAIDGKAVDNAYTLSRARQQQYAAAEAGYWRYIPNREVQLELGVISRAASAVMTLAPVSPIGHAIANSPNIVTARINFKPQKDQIYQVNGFISPSYVALWLENLDGKIVSDIAELTAENVDRSMISGILDFDRRKSIGYSTKAERFLNVRGGDQKDTLINKLGMPSSEEMIPSKRRNFERVAYRYEGLGLVVFGNQLAKSYEFTSYIKPDFTLIPFDDALNSKNPLMRQAFARYYRKDGELSEQRLDAIAASLWQWRMIDNVNIVESNAVFCRILAKSGNPRYLALLETISQETAIEKLKRHAEAGLAELNATLSEGKK